MNRIYWFKVALWPLSAFLSCALMACQPSARGESPSDGGLPDSASNAAPPGEALHREIPNCEPQTDDEKSVYGKGMPKRSLQSVTFDGGRAVASTDHAGRVMPIHQESKTPSDGGAIDWSQYLPPAYDQGQCSTCYVHVGMEYFAALYARANHQAPVWYDVTPVVINATAVKATPILDTSFANYTNPSVTVGTPSWQFQFAACNVGGWFEEIVQSMLLMRESGPNKFFCPQPHDTPFSAPEPNAYFVGHQDAGYYVGYPVESCSGGACTFEAKLEYCDVGPNKTNFVPPAFTLATFANDVDRPQLTRIVTAPSWVTHVLDLGDSPMGIGLTTKDAYGIVAYDHLIHQDAGALAGKCTEMLIGNRLKLTDFDVGNHMICVAAGNVANAAGCEMRYARGDVDHALMVVNSQESSDENGEVINLTIRNTWGAQWGSGGNLLASGVLPQACKQDSDCTTSFGDVMQEYGWAALHWTMKCEPDGTNVCVPSMEDGFAPEVCEDNLKCPSATLINAGGRCTSYFHRTDLSPLGTQTYCLPTMYEAGISSMSLSTVFWE